jgi:hypothetical protein
VAHVGCCVLLLSTTALLCIVDKIDYVVCRGFWQVVRTYVLWYKKKKGVNVGHSRHENVVTGSCRPKVPTFGCRADMSPTCRQHCQPRQRRCICLSSSICCGAYP